MTAPERNAPANLSLSSRTQAAIFTRLFAVQGSWNYETMLGTGVGFCVEPALRNLPGGIGGEAFCEALARETRYFNSHPYLAGAAVGALARVELERRPAAQIERFRSALCGPLGSVGDQLVWAGWLPVCSLLSLLLFGLGVPALGVVVAFLSIYNVGHVALRVWALRAGWREGLRVAVALGSPILRRGPQHIARTMMFLAGAALPVALARLASATAPDIGRNALIGMLVGAGVLGFALVKLKGTLEGWKVALGVLAVVVAYAVSP
ncbi:MAG TPA: PTS system mannose/fructose/sorbose family transporter subunit IID [Gemmatimonadaceae bacterium]|nr:PTS system mannose/fructose/sorbose family transporter subunit IID [Gemmatimonadaceae bacterium]